MPELPEVENIKFGLEEVVINKQIFDIKYYCYQNNLQKGKTDAVTLFYRRWNIYVGNTAGFYLWSCSNFRKIMDFFYEREGIYKRVYETAV